MLCCTTLTTTSDSEPFLWLYESSGGDWPVLWSRRGRILYGSKMLSGNALNPVRFFHAADSTWYLLVFDDGIGLERIYSSKRVYGGYVEHPVSQRYGWRHVGGVLRVGADTGGSLWAFVQAAEGVYTVTALEIEELSRTSFEYGIMPWERSME